MVLSAGVCVCAGTQVCFHSYMCTSAHVHLRTCMLVTTNAFVTLGMGTCVHPVRVGVSIF